MVRKFNPEGVPAPAFYSHAAEVEAGQRLLFISGQVGVTAQGEIAEGVEAQAALAVANLKGVLAAAGMDVGDVAKLTIYLIDPADMEGFMKGAASLVAQPPAATTLVYVKALASPAMRVEIEAMAAK
jgi:2-iminobutanoate/2-iminopropanoate deaminase